MIGARLAAVVLAMTHDRMLANLAGAVGAGAGLFIHDRTPVVGWSPSVVGQRAWKADWRDPSSASTYVFAMLFCHCLGHRKAQQ